MSNFLKRTWAEVNLDNLIHNYKQIRKQVNERSKIMCVVKADAYGHGTKYIIKELENLNVDWFAVSNIEEAIQLRNFGATKPILILGYTPVEMARTLYNYNISQAILSEDYAMRLIEECRKWGIFVKGHIKIDTGMSRIGFLAQNNSEIETSLNSISKISKYKEIQIEGIFTHFSVSDDPINGVEYTNKQFNNFNYVIKNLENCGIKIPLKHCCNSGGIIEYPNMHMDMVRAGIILYGLAPSNLLENKLDLRPVMTLKTVVSQLKEICEETSISYGRTFCSKNKMKIATVPIGYADGYSRDFSNNAYMIIDGKRAKIVGRVCMDQLMLDVSNIENVNESSIVTVFGESDGESISANELAKISNTINYEIVCLIGKRVPRIYYKNNREVGKLNYI